MKKSVLKIANISPNIRISSCSYNLKSMLEKIDEVSKEQTDIIVFPRMATTGYTLGDMAKNKELLKNSLNTILKIKEATKNKKFLVAVGAILEIKNGVFDTVVLTGNGKIYSIIINNNLNRNAEFDECKIFDNYELEDMIIKINEEEVLVTNNHIFNIKDYTIGIFNGNLTSESFGKLVEISKYTDLLIHLDSTYTLIDTDDKIENMIKTISSINNCIYVYSNVGNGQSSTDVYYESMKVIAQNGKILDKTTIFNEKDTIMTYVNLNLTSKKKYIIDSGVNIDIGITDCSGYIEKANPYINDISLKDYSKKSIMIQVKALAQRMKSINVDKLVLGISGGLDSTLALIVAYETMKYLKYSNKNIITVTMPCFGTSSRTFNNANMLMDMFDTTKMEIDITESVKKHLKDISHSGKADTAFENAQARERTQILLDLANMNRAIVIGTGDLSEIALGFATFSGDHIANYSVNASIPKTVIRSVVKNYADENNEELKKILYDILDTPISPELLPIDGESNNQKTEEIVGPYILHDFFIYYHTKYGLSYDEIFFMAKNTFNYKFEEKVIKKWLELFYKRFITSQFKRSCSVDGVNVTGISLSPRTSWNMPSDMEFNDWIEK